MPNAVKKPGKQPQDRQPKAVEQAPPADQPREVEINGHSYTIDTARFDLAFQELMEDEKYVLVLRHLLGREQWDRFKEENTNEAGLIDPSVLDDFQAVAFEGN